MSRPTKPIPAKIAERAATRYTVTEDGCWESGYSKTVRGYATLGDYDGETGKTSIFLAHRASWTYYRGPIAPGMTIDHQCYNRACINPDHLRELSLRDNSRRHSGHDWPLGTCPWGHPDSEQRQVTWVGYTRWTCGPCADERNRISSQWRGALRRLEKHYPDAYEGIAS